MKRRNAALQPAVVLAAIVLVVVGGLLATGCGAAKAEGPIVIGAVVSTTGAAAPLGEPERNTLQLMESSINAAGGVIGRQIKVVILDDQSAAKEAVTATNRLLQQDKAVAVIGASTSASTLAMKPITSKAGIPQIAMAAANAITDEAPIDWMWRVAPKDNLAVARALKFVADGLKVKKIAVLYDENAFGSSGMAEIERTVAEYGLEVVAKESYKTDEADLTAQLTKIKGANPEALVVWGTNPGPAVAAKNLKQLGMSIPYVGSHGIANAKFIELAADAAEGVVFPSNKVLLPESITDPAQKAVVTKFMADYKAKYGSAPNSFAAHAYDGLTVLLEAIKAAKGTDPKALQTQLNKLTKLSSAGGIFTYTATDHDGLSVDDMIMVKISGGKWTLAN
jgi:branched-chain amino acid transport system substrate-binding protein